jgi:DNA polymerase-1
MKPQEELTALKMFVSLSESRATKRDDLEGFLGNMEKVLLLDADSLLFNVAHFHLDKDTGMDDQYEDFLSQVRAITNRIEDDGFSVFSIDYFFTTCKNNFRKELLPSYKANRPKNDTTRFVYELKEYVINELVNELESVYTSDTLEADDLISNNQDKENCIIVSIDKDLKQIEGCHFDYYKVKTGLINEFGDEVKDYRGWQYTTKEEGTDLLLKQLLIGDNADNIKGVKGVGKVKADKLIDGKSHFGKVRAVYEAYNDKERLRTNIKLMAL